MITPLICQSPHPRHPNEIHGVRVGFWGGHAVPTGRILAQGATPAPGCIAVPCLKCKRATEYRLLGRAAAELN